MSVAAPVKALAVALIIVASAVVIITAPSPTPPPPQLRVRTDKNCYLPAQTVTITLKNVGGSTAVYASIPDFEVENGTFGTVRMVRDYERGRFELAPGESVNWTWDQKWRAWDADGRELHKGMYVPEGDYVVLIEAEFGFPIPDIVILAQGRFSIGECLAQISAGDDVLIDEGQPYTFRPVIQITGDAELRSVTWDLDPGVDANGDGNFTNDIDLAGRTPTYTWGDDGVFNVTMNVRGFGRISGMDRVPQDVVFAMDSSGSMLYNDPLQLRKVASKAYVDRLAPPDRAAVVDFDTTARVVNGDHLSTDYERVKANIDTLDASGGTYLGGGLLVSLFELRDYGNGDHFWLIIFMTDADSVTLRDRFDIPRAIDLAKDLGVSVYTVGLNIADDEAEDLMRDIASQTGGRYFPAPTADNLYKIFNDIGNETSEEGQFFTVSDTFTVGVRNVAPSVSVDTTTSLNVTLRVAGEKYHDVSMVLYRDGAEVGRASVLRMPGSPDNQSASLGTVEFDVASTYDATVVYTPLDDVINGQVQGADPAWVILGLPNGTELWFHHTFNYQQPETWVWDVTDVEALFLGRSFALEAVIADPGSDDLTVSWDWGDGAVDTRVYLSDPAAGPDPFPSPWGGPMSLTDLGLHTFAVGGTYTITLTVTDDDGGTTVLTIPVSVTGGM